jgi:hypothetical protein
MEPAELATPTKQIQEKLSNRPSSAVIKQRGGRRGHPSLLIVMSASATSLMQRCRLQITKILSSGYLSSVIQ